MEVDKINPDENDLYVKCCIIANGVEDSQGDTLNAEQIKKIFTSFNNKNSFELYHNDIPIDDVSLLENYISQSDEKLGTKIIPKGSWNGVIKVRNEEVKEKLLNNELCGVSLSNRIAERCSAGLSGQITYNDVPQIDCVIPVYISFVERGANGYPLQIMDYPAYIKKSENIGVNKKMSFDLLGSLKNLVKQAEDESDAVVASDTSILKGEDVEVKEEDATIKKEEDVTILKEEEVCPNKKEEESEKIEKSDEKSEEEEDEAEIEKAEEASEEVAEETTEEEPAEEESSDDELENKIREIIEKILAEKEEETAEEESDEPKITKSKKVIVENTNEPQTKNYFELSGRDPITGMKLRK